MSRALRSLVEIWQRGAADHDARALLVGASPEVEQLRDHLQKFLDKGPAKAQFLTICSDDIEEREGIVDVVDRLARRSGFEVVTTRDGWGKWAQDLNKGLTTSKLHIVVGKNDKQLDGKLRSRLIEAGTRIVFFWPLAAYNTRDVMPGSFQCALDHISERSGDAACALVAGILHYVFADDDGALAERVVGLLDDAAIDAIGALAGPGTSRRSYADIRDASQLAAQHIRAHAAIRRNDRLVLSELQAAMFRPSNTPPVTVRRLWVEGETDKTLFELAARVVAGGAGSTERNLLRGIIVQAINGCARFDEAVQNCRSQRALEFFLFDNDEDGRRTKEKAIAQNLLASTLDESAVVSACQRDWVLEDLISVDAIDRFYQSMPGVKPAREELCFDAGKLGRRIVVAGSEKLRLVEWLRTHGTAKDLFGVAEQLVMVRRAFALAPVELPIHRERPSSFGKRPEPWWFVVPQ